MRVQSGWCDNAVFEHVERIDSCTLYTVLMYFASEELSSPTQTHMPFCLAHNGLKWINMSEKVPIGAFPHLIVLSLVVSHSKYEENIVFNQFVYELP